MAPAVRALALAAAGFLEAASAHSWLACSDYRGDVNFYDDSKCFGYPRRWESTRRGAVQPIENGYQIGIDTGYNFDGAGACQHPHGTADAYSAGFPKATYEAGKTYCLAWPTKNHAAASCTNQFIPDAKMSLYVSSSGANSDPSQAEFFQRPVTHYFGSHTDKTIDCLGFQRAPRFCDNTDKAMATGCFVAPSAVGDYIFQWYWEFNLGSAPYKTCWDAKVVASGAGTGGGTVTGTPNSNLNGNSGLCATAWASVSGSTPPDATATKSPTPLGPAPTSSPTEDGGGTMPPSNTSPPETEPPSLEGNQIRFARAPKVVLPRGTFPVKVEYSHSDDEPLLLTVDILDASDNWYGKGILSLSSAGKGQVEVNVQVQNNPALGSFYILRAWIVRNSDSSKNAPWAYELARNDIPVTFGNALEYPATASPTDSSSSDGGLSTGAAVGISFFVLAVVGAAIGVGVFHHKKSAGAGYTPSPAKEHGSMPPIPHEMIVTRTSAADTLARPSGERPSFSSAPPATGAPPSQVPPPLPARPTVNNV